MIPAFCQRSRAVAPGRRPRARNAAKFQRTLAAWGFAIPFLALFLLVFVAPLIYAFVTSLFRSSLVRGLTFAGLDAYIRAIADTHFWEGLARVGLFLIVQVPIMLGVALFLALAIDSGRLLGYKIVRLIVFLPYVVPAVVAALMWGYLYGKDFGLIAQICRTLLIPAPDFLGQGSILGSIMNIVCWEFIGYNMVVMYSALQAIPRESFESALIDGASHLRIAWSIKIPATRRAMMICVTFSIVGSFQLFTEPAFLRTLAPGAIGPAFTPNLYAYNVAFQNQDIPYSAALAFVLGLVVMLIAYGANLLSSRLENGRQSKGVR